MPPFRVLWPGGPWLWGLLAHLALEEQPEFVLNDIDNSTFTHLTLID